MDTHEPVPMTRRRYRSLLAAAEDAGRTTTARSVGAPGPVDLGGPVPAPRAATAVPVPLSRSRRGPVSAVPVPRSRRRASIRSPRPVAS